MSDLSVTHCPICRAVINRAWTSCFVCGNPAQASPASGSKAPGPDLPDRLLEMSLDTFEVEGAPIEIHVPWWPAPLWFVPGEPDVVAVMKVGVSRGSVWTTRELISLLEIPGLTSTHVTTITRAKMIFEGTVRS